MADVFREVDEDLRREQIRKLWDRYAPYILGLAVVIVLGVSAYKIMEFWQRHEAETSGDKFIAAMELGESGKSPDSILALQDVTTEGTGGYPVLALFAIAAQKADSGDPAAAVVDYDAIAARVDVSADIKVLARLRAALLLVDSAPFADISKRVADLATVGNPWHASAREVLALSAWHNGNLSEAKTYFDQINADQEAPVSMRQRAQVMLTLIAARQGASAAALAPGAVAPNPAVAIPAPVAAPAPAVTGPASAAPAPAEAPPPAALAPPAAPAVAPADAAAPAAPAVAPADAAAPAAPAVAPADPAAAAAPAVAPADPAAAAAPAVAPADAAAPAAPAVAPADPAATAAPAVAPADPAATAGTPPN